MAFLDDVLDFDPRRNSHERRVSAYTIVIAKRMGIPKDEIQLYTRGAFLHDIEKMGIPERILSKIEPLTAEEWDVIRQHAYNGYKIVSAMPLVAEAAELVHGHHERFDGGGYPRGLRGDEIPLGARIIAVANTLDSVTSDLPYRHARNFRAAFDEIQAGSGTQFDPAIVDVFLRTPELVWRDVRDEIAKGE
jgi:HD-GYP domain-containing protein (c-di-GMP phosphodiesterase class II)